MVGSVVVTLLTSIHWTTVHGRKLPWDAVITSAFIGNKVFGFTGVKVNGALPAAAELGVIELRVGVGSAVTEVDSVKGKEGDTAIEFETDTVAVPGNAASAAGTTAVS
jgi:hypothetical protein